MDFYVYCWANTTTGKRYIGKGRHGRAMDHLWLAFTKSSRCPRFHAAIRKHGTGAFELGYIATGLDEATAYHVEGAFVAMYGTQGEYNLTAGGTGRRAGFQHSPETRARISTSQRGKVVSAESAARSGAAQRGKVVSAETRARQAARRLGQVVSADARAKMSAARKGRPRTEGAKAKAAATQAGRMSGIVGQYTGQALEAFAVAHGTSPKSLKAALLGAGWRFEGQGAQFRRIPPAVLTGG